MMLARGFFILSLIASAPLSCKKLTKESTDSQTSGFGSLQGLQRRPTGSGCGADLSKAFDPLNETPEDALKRVVSALPPYAGLSYGPSAAFQSEEGKVFIDRSRFELVEAAEVASKCSDTPEAFKNAVADPEGWASASKSPKIKSCFKLVNGVPHIVLEKNSVNNDGLEMMLYGMAAMAGIVKEKKDSLKSESDANKILFEGYMNFAASIEAIGDAYIKAMKAAEPKTDAMKFSDYFTKLFGADFRNSYIAKTFIAVESLGSWYCNVEEKNTGLNKLRPIFDGKIAEFESALGNSQNVFMALKSKVDNPCYVSGQPYFDRNPNDAKACKVELKSF